MKKIHEKILFILFIITGILLIGVSTFAHSGRTDSSGGHRDNKNKSGLGSYHYHCGGNPAHLHTGGECPYSSNTSKGSKSNSEEDTKETIAKPSDIEVTKVEINASTKSIEVGESKILTATILPSNATNKKISWESSDESIAMINEEGKLVAKGAGTVDITATMSNGKTSTIKVNVNEKSTVENNTIIKTATNNQVGNKEETIGDKKEKANPLAGIIGLGTLGGAGYAGYRKFKKE